MSGGCAEDETIPDVIYVCAWKGSDMRHLERGICVATGDGAAVSICVYQVLTELGLAAAAHDIRFNSLPLPGG